MGPAPTVSIPDRNGLFPRREYSQLLPVALAAKGGTLSHLAHLHPYKSKGPQPDQNRSARIRGQTIARLWNARDGDIGQSKSQKIQCQARYKTDALAPLA